jgi:3-oxoacyl-[acyl-carrier protein] reductase
MIDPAKVFRLDGRAALVTGATRGIGLGIAEAFVAAGAAVCVTARKQEELDETLDALRTAGGNVTAFRGSAGDPEAIEASVAHCISELGGIDILVNNAATNPQYGPLVEADMGMVDKVWEVNQAGPLRYAQTAWRDWMQEHGGNIINISSVGGIRAGTTIGAYNVSKAALIHMTKIFAQEMAPKVRCNAIAPGLVKTYFARALYEGHEEAVANRHPLKRIGVPDDIAGAALFLASDASAWMTGQVIVVDGGMSLI